MSRFLCCGDLHLDAGPDLGRAPGDRLREQEEVWRRCLEIAAEEDVDAVLFAGDAFHKARPTPEAMLAFERPLVEVNNRDVKVFAIVGNHDRSGVAAGTGLHVFAEAGLLTLFAAEPGVWRLPGVSVCALPWAPVSRIVAAHGGGDRDDLNAYAAELLVEVARGLRAQVDGPAILLTHFSISGSSLPNGLPVEQLREPVLELGELEALGFDAIVAGHIHEPQALLPSRSSHVLFPDEDQETVGGASAFYVGSPMPLNFGEASVPHGVWILETDPISSRFVPIESRRLRTIDLDIASMEDDGIDALGEFFDALSADAWQDVDGQVVKVRIRALAEQARRLDVAALKRTLYEAGAHKVYAVQLEVERAERARVEGLDEELDELAALALWLEAESVNGDRAAALRERTEAYMAAIR